VKPILLIVAISLPWAVCQENKAELMHWSIAGVRITAANIQRDASPSTNPDLPAIYLRGNVEIIKPSCSDPASAKPCYTKLVVRADEAEYHPDTSEIKPSGHVRVTFEELK
jgi:hypothetical protein